MNKAETIEAIKVMQAYVDGRVIKTDTGNVNYSLHAIEVSWNWNSFNYDIKPQPIEIWCMVNSKGHCLSNQYSESEIIELIGKLNRENNKDFVDYKAVKFREVLDE